MKNTTDEYKRVRADFARRPNSKRVVNMEKELNRLQAKISALESATKEKRIDQKSNP